MMEMETEMSLKTNSMNVNKTAFAQSNDKKIRRLSLNEE
jgi:hypothetical protein